MRFLKMLLSPFISAAPAIPGPLVDGGAAYKKGDYATALRLLLPLASQGEASAQYNIGLMYNKGEGVVQDYAVAMSWYRKAGDQGHVLAQFALGLMYFDGLGVSQDYGQALEWYLKAAKQGHALAQANLGMMFGNGLGVPRYHDIALMWLILAAEVSEKENRDQIVKLRDTAARKMTHAQIAEAQRLAREWKVSNVAAGSPSVPAKPFEEGLAAAEKGDYATALRLWRPLADQGEPNSQYNIGIMYDQGKGVPRDQIQAAAWYQKAADQGHPFAQHNIGFMYANGQGVPQDFAAAVVFYRKAAEQGLSAAQYNLGRMYNQGKGVLQDYEQAAVWYRKAADQGYAEAQYNIGLLYSKGQGVSQDAAAAASWFRKAAEQGYAPAQRVFGAMCSRSLQRSVEAYMWLTLAASRYESSQTRDRDRVLNFREIVAARMTPAQIAEAEKLACDWKPTPQK